MNSGVIIAISILLFIFVLLVCRAIIVWWLGVSDVIVKQNEIVELLKQHLAAQSMMLETAQRTNSILQRMSDTEQPVTAQKAIVTQRSLPPNPLTGR